MDCSQTQIINETKFVSFNCYSLKNSVDYVRKLCQTADFLALQETWLLPDEIPYLGNIDPDFAFTGKSAVDPTTWIQGRAHGGLGILWRKNVFQSVSVVECTSARIAAVKVKLENREFLVMSVYMPTDKLQHLDMFISCLGEINAVIESCNIDSVYILGDFNAKPGTLFGTELLNFCVEQKWSCADIDILGLQSNSYTYLSNACGATSWLDHIITTEVARKTVVSANIRYEVSTSDHFAIEVNCDLNFIVPKVKPLTSVLDSVAWGERDKQQIDKYYQICSEKLRDVDFPDEFRKCSDILCNNLEHRMVIDKMYDKIVKILRDASSECSKISNRSFKKKRFIIGWNKHCKEAHGEARLCFHDWITHGKPKSGRIFNKMRESRRIFKNKMKWCKNNETQIKMDILATHHSAKNFNQFWKETNKLNPKPSVPVSVEGISDPSQIANLFKNHFRVQSPLEPANLGTQVGIAQAEQPVFRITAKHVAQVLKDMKRGKSPGHDSLSIEHLQHAGVHLPRVLAMFFTFCIGHSYLPEAVMKTVVVPIVKNKTGDVSSVGNYRPISLATIIAKVLDGVIETQLRNHLKLHDAQFGFRPGHSTEVAILSLKHTVQYYTDRNTPVYACFLDLSKAFDLVAYDRLWQKLSDETELPPQFISLLKYWYSNQSNYVRWAGSLSDVYRLECGVRQGGLSSPCLFNLYIDRLIRELGSTRVGCSIDGVSVNNISYADDMVLLSPSISALRQLIVICERYAEAHGLRYNANKSELMVFKAGSKTYNTVPPVTLNGSTLTKVSHFKYLGHWVTETLEDDMDIERERRALSVRANMLARRFARCTEQVKVTLFRAYCQSFYTCSLWVKHTKKSYNALRVLYNNAFRAVMKLPRWCSASGMFADARIDGFPAIMRKRVASLMRRVRASSNTYLQVFASRMDLECPIMQHWTKMHIEHSGSKPKFRLK